MDPWINTLINSSFEYDEDATLVLNLLKIVHEGHNNTEMDRLLKETLEGYDRQ